MKNGSYNFNYSWKFRLADAFPLAEALEAVKDSSGRMFYEREYDDSAWEKVSVPHTYNDEDLFRQRGDDAGSNQKRTFSCYRKWFDKVEKLENKKLLIEFEGIRQTCYLYVNGQLAGYIESGVQPFGFDITPFIYSDKENLIAVATDSTSTRNMSLFSAETPNMPEAIPGTFVASNDKVDNIPNDRRGVPYFWNSNDFNPCIGGLTKNVWLHIKPKTYITLPLYSNLRTYGVYVYGSDYDIENKAVTVNTEAQVRNEGAEVVEAVIRTSISDREGNVVLSVCSEEADVKPAKDCLHEMSVIPGDAYEKMPDGSYRAKAEDEVFSAVECVTKEGTIIHNAARLDKAVFWNLTQPYLYNVKIELLINGEPVDAVELETGFRKVSYTKEKGLEINDEAVWLSGYAQRSANEWAAVGCTVDWMKDYDALLIRESNATHIRYMHVAACPADIRACDRYGVVCTQPAGDKERESFGRQWNQRLEAMRDVIIYFRNNPSIFFWEAGNNSINKEHMRQMRELKEALDPSGGRFMGCRTINTVDVVEEAEYVGTMLNRHAARFQSERMPVTETEYSREEAPRRVWDDYTPPHYDYKNLWLGKGGRKLNGGDSYDLTSEEFALSVSAGYAEFFNDRVGGASGKNLYSAAAALCWSDSAQHSRQQASENCRMSGRVDAVRIKKQNFDVFRVLQSSEPMCYIVGHWNYPANTPENYLFEKKEYDGTYWQYTGTFERRNPEDKTIYVIGSYYVKSIELFINGVSKGICDHPTNTFVFAFEHVNITENGYIEAIATGYDGSTVSHRIETTGKPAKLRLTLHTGEKGLIADGSDIAFVDVEVLDDAGRLCPLCDERIDFSMEGPGKFLGGYNEGRFNGFGRNDSVIHCNYVYATCGNNRVFVRAGFEPGKIRLRATMAGAENAELEFDSICADTNPLSLTASQRLAASYINTIPEHDYSFPRQAEADATKYVKSDEILCKVLVNGQEPNTYGVLSKVEHDSIFSPVLHILGAMAKSRPEDLQIDYKNETLTMKSGEHTIIARVGYTHLTVDGTENLMGGQPYLLEDGTFMMEINAIAGYIKGATAGYDDKITVYRIEW